MAIKEIVKGICGITRCKYDVYTKEKIDEMTRVSNKDYSDITEPGIYLVDCRTMTDNLAEIPMPHKISDAMFIVTGMSEKNIYRYQVLDNGMVRFIRHMLLEETGEVVTVGNWQKSTLNFEEISSE